MMDEIRLEHAKVILREKFGVEASRIFQILLNKKRLEEKQVCEAVL